MAKKTFQPKYNAQTLKGSKAFTSAYAEDEILMPKARGNLVPAIIGMDIDVPDLDADNDVFDWHLSIKSQDAVGGLDDEDVVIAGGYNTAGALAAGATIFNQVERITLPAPIPITSDKLYLGATVTPNSTIKYRLYIVWRYIPGVVQKQSSQSVEF